MSNLYKYEPKAVVTTGPTSVTLYGDAARAVVFITLTTLVIISVALISKAWK